MMTLPEVIERSSQPYIYVPFTVRMDQMHEPADQGFPQLFAFIEKQGLKPAGAPFYNYRRIDMEDTLDVEAGIAVEADGQAEGNVLTGILPGGRFMGVDWHGHPDHLITVTGLLVGWSRLTQQDFDMETKADGDHFACRLEIYESDPEEVPNKDEWLTRLSFKLKG